MGSAAECLPAAVSNTSASLPAAAIAKALLAWYDRNRRELPWRTPPGQPPDAYGVWLSEIMLQQTTVKAVIPYYSAFLKRWPNVGALAKASRDDVLRAWAGLGYYSRARNLHDCAKQVAGKFGGRFPTTGDELLMLPGIGPYTAAAIAAIAFDDRVLPVDGNVERVISRLAAVEQPLPASKPTLRNFAGGLAPKSRSGDFAQAMMDLGATVCSPRRPSCMICPLKDFCSARRQDIAETLPRRLPRPDRPLRHGVAFVALNERGEILLRRRPDKGLLGGMTEVPTTEWLADWLEPEESLRTAPIKTRWFPVPGAVSHTFTHFRLGLMVYRAHVRNSAALTLWARQEDCRWVSRDAIKGEALPSVMRKVIAHALADIDQE